MKRTMILAVLLLATGCPSNGGGEPDGDTTGATTGDTNMTRPALSVTIDVEDGEVGMDSNSTISKTSLADGTATYTVHYTKAHPGAGDPPVTVSHALTDEQFTKVQALVEKLLDAKDVGKDTNSPKQGRSMNFEIATVELQLGEKTNSFKLMGATGVEGEELPFAKDPTLLIVQELKQELRSAAQAED